ncbi:MAG: GNAT family N-acetyltransferase [Spirochaetaceae bacterium]|nr:GNAT family N-acetyltransferase [Spirochaetaceae bacterium]
MARGSTSALSGEPSVRFAKPEDIPRLVGFIREFAAYEGLEEQLAVSEERLARYLFEEPKGEALIVEYAGEEAGFALFFETFSTFLGKPSIYVEDIFIRPVLRGRGLGKALFSVLARLAVERNCGRMEWACLNWNEPAIRFYLKHGAQPLREWTTYRLTGADLTALAGGSGSE